MALTRTSATKKNKQKTTGTRTAISAESKTISAINIDFPQEGERLNGAHYAIRVSAPKATQVEISVNSGTWQIARQSVGYWWLDLWPKAAGEYKIKARARDQAQGWIESTERICAFRVFRKNGL